MSSTETRTLNVSSSIVRTSQIGNADPVVTTDRYPLFITNSVTRGGSVPHWRKVIARGDNATTFLSGIERSVSTPLSEAEYVQTAKFGLPGSGKVTRYRVEGNLCYLGSPPSSLDLPTTATVNEALTRYYSRMQAAETRFKGLVFVGELRESLLLINQPAKAFRRGIGDYLTHVMKHGRRIPRRRRLSWLAETWLEYSFGWAPLISDLDRGIKAFYSSKLIRPIFEMVSGSAEKVVDSHLQSAFETFGPLQWIYKIRDREICSVRYFGIYRHTGNGISNNHHFGFRPNEFIPAVWELIPYSFLVDYFTNIGDIVSSWSYRFGGTSWTARTIRRERKYLTYDEHVLPVQGDTNFDRTANGSFGHYESSFKSVTRTPDLDPGLPSLELQVPGLGTKWVNILALSLAHTKALNALRL